MAVAVVGHSPACLRTVVAIVDDACAVVDVGTDGVGIGAAAHAAVLLRDALISVVQKGVADVVHVHIVGFAAVVALAGAFVGTDADAFVEPSEAFRHVALVIEHLIHMGLYIVRTLHRETTGEDFQIVVVAFQLSEPVVGAATAHRVGGEVGIVANEQDVSEVAFLIVVNALDVVLDQRFVVAADFSQADYRGGASRLVLPLHVGLHGIHVLVGADDQHFAEVLDESVS